MSLNRISAASSAAVCSFVLASGVLAQGELDVGRTTDGSVSKPELEEQKQNLRERNRSSLYPGDPLVIVGIEQGDNDIRSRTPALLNSDRKSTRVNDDEAYRRKLALYEDGGHTLQPVVIARPIAQPTPVAPQIRKPASDAPPPREHQVVSVCIGLLASALFGFWAFKRYANLFTRSGA